MKMNNLTFDAITSPKRINKDTIEGFVVCGEKTIPVTVQRMLNGWDVDINVVIDGVQFHKATPTPTERDEFNVLMGRAVFDESSASNAKHAMLTQLCRTRLLKA